MFVFSWATYSLSHFLGSLGVLKYFVNVAGICVFRIFWYLKLLLLLKGEPGQAGDQGRDGPFGPIGDPVSDKSLHDAGVLFIVNLDNNHS